MDANADMDIIHPKYQNCTSRLGISLVLVIGA